MMTKKIESLLELGFATIFIGAVFMDLISAEKIIVNILLFVIFIELIRMVGSFISSEGREMKIRYILDGSIIYLLREIILEVTKDDQSIEHKILEIAIMLGILTFLFIFRIMASKFSPDRDSGE